MGARIIGIIAILLLSVIVLGCLETQSSESTSKVYGITKIGEFSISVVDINRNSDILTVELEIKNEGNLSNIFSADIGAKGSKDQYVYALKDKNDSSYYPDKNIYLTLNPGQKTRQKVNFKIPSDPKDYKFAILADKKYSIPIGKW